MTNLCKFTRSKDQHHHREHRGSSKRGKKKSLAYLFQSNLDFSNVLSFAGFPIAANADSPPPLALFGGPPAGLTTGTGATTFSSFAFAPSVETRGVGSVESDPNRASSAVWDEVETSLPFREGVEDDLDEVGRRDWVARHWIASSESSYTSFS